MLSQQGAPLMRWRPYLGQEALPAPVVIQRPVLSQAPAPPSDWADNTKRKLAALGMGAGIGTAFGLIRTLLFPKWRMTRQQAAIGVLLTGGFGALVTLAPLGKSSVLETVAIVSGALAGTTAVNVAFPKKQRKQ